MNQTARIGVIIPARNEEACIAPVLEELLALLDPAKYAVAVGVNDSSDRTAEIARRYPVLVAETPARGYGYGCVAAIAALTRGNPDVRAYVFCAGDGASDPRDVPALVAAHEQGYAMVLGARTLQRRNWRTMTLPHVLANLSLGCWCGILSGRFFRDLAPLRLIERNLFEAIAPREMKFGWTIEAQIGAAMIGASVREIPAGERPRLAGEQKVSGVNWRRTFVIGCRIVAAGWRTWRRFRRRATASVVLPPTELIARADLGS
jgi:glycosyltransferase involved in cell wall biosynthesis